MQRFESYNLAGTRRPTPTPVPDTLADAVARRTLDRTLEEVRRRAAAATPRRARPATTPVVPVMPRGFEARPAGAVALGGVARRGGVGDLAWAMREIRNMSPNERRSFAQANPELIARTVAKLDHLIDRLEGEQRANGRPLC